MTRIPRLVAIPLLAACMARADDRPLVTSPADGQKLVGFRMEATGRTPAKTFPFFAVEPLAASPQTWIQPRIHSHGADGSVIGWINLGNAEEGAEQTFLVFLLACEKEDPFGKTKVIQAVPRGCIASAPVRVFRER